MNKAFNFFIPLSKVDEAQRLVYGIATAELLDKSGEVFDYDSSLPYYKEWSGEIQKASGGKSLGNVREMHTNIAAGKLTQIEFNDEKKQIEVCAKIVNESTWEKVMEGVLTGFSHGGEYIKTWKDPNDSKVTRYTARPSEISVVDNPCLGAATFELVRADGATEMRKFKTKEQPMTETVIDGKPVQPQYKPVQKWEASDGKTFEKKEEWRVYELQLEAAAKTSAVTMPALSAIAELEKAVSEKEGLEKKEDSGDQVAKAADESKKKEKAAKLADLKKSLAEAYDAKTAIEALCIIECLMSGEEWEVMTGAGEEGQIADLKEAISRLKSFIAAEIMEGSEEDLEEITVMEMAAGLPDDENAKALVKAWDDFLNKDETRKASLRKSGARHSASDKGHLSKALGHLDEAREHHEDAAKAHGHVTKAIEGMRDCMGKMAGCMKAMGGVKKADGEATEAFQKEAKEVSDHLDAMEGHLDKAEKHHGKVGKAHDGMAAAHDGIGHALKAVGAMDSEAEKAAESEAMVKVAADEEKLKKAVDELTLTKGDLAAKESENAELKKALDTINGQVPSLIERIKKLEAQPMPAKGAVFPVEKGHEAKTEPAKPVEAPSYSTYGASPAEMREILRIRP